jgi:Fe-S-cluster-containing dehydrogenase component
MPSHPTRPSPPSQAPRAEQPRGSDDSLQLGRRSVIQLMGASMLAALGASGCVRKPPRESVSRETAPEYARPGVPLWYASTWTEGRFPYGLLVKTQEGRPTKIEGNPDHPVNRGASSAAMQAGLLSLYDPARLRAPRGAATWDQADERVRQALGAARRAVLMSRATLGPSERTLVRRFLDRFPAVRHLVFEPAGDRPRRLAWQELYGRDGEWIPQLGRAAVIVAIGSDFLMSDGAELEATRALADARAGQADGATGPDAHGVRLYAIEGDATLTGLNADQRIRLRPSAMPALLQAVRGALRGSALAGFASDHGVEPVVLEALLADLRSHQGETVILAGPDQPPAVHAGVALLNEELGAPGKTLRWSPRPAGLVPDAPQEIASALGDGVDVLILLGVNPVHGWPGGGFEPLLRKASLSVAHGPFADETMQACTLGLPSHHNLESWNDAEPRPGLTSLCQPVLQPLWDSRQEAVSLMTWLGMPADDEEAGHRRPSFRALLRQRIESELLAPGPGVEVAWQQALQRGVIVNERTPDEPPALDRARAEARLGSAPAPASGLELTLRPHAGAADGRFGNNAWLLELPDPVTKVMWNNPLRVSPRTAAERALETGDVVAVTAGAATVELPVLVQPGVADGVLGADLGMGQRVEALAIGVVGVNTHPLLAGTAAARSEVSLVRTGRKHRLALSQVTFSMHERPIVLRATVEALRADPELIQKQRARATAPSIYPPYERAGDHKWAKSIDLDRCTGCQACVVACQAENNIPVVGPAECANRRFMHWLRLDLYRDGDPDNPTTHLLPMLCQQCDNAPCENVCPVAATSHSHEGLNQQVYNRCVGTRYCSNNCPYKVRRFNYYRYQERLLTEPVQKLMSNPNVTVRGVGVMEKCTFCIQRINAAKFRAANEGRPIQPGELLTACQQACPARAIDFGDVRSGSPSEAPELVRASASRRAFGVLEELNVAPSITYLARVRNPAVPSGGAERGGG